MSITLSIYDIFANTIPGFVYLFAINDLIRILGYSYYDLSKLTSFTQFILIGLLAYLTGHIFDYISYRLWIRLFQRKATEEQAYKQFREKYHNLRVEFEPKQWPLLFSVIRHNEFVVANEIEKSKAISLMLRNISFGLFLLYLEQLFLTFDAGFSLPNLVFGLSALVGSIVSFRRGTLFSLRFYTMTYEHALLYGKSLSEILNKEKSKKSGKPA